jgi:DNA-binding transcriptional regulator YdaS (Cro superfamily)
MKPTPNQDRARAAWGKATPDWIVALAAACDASTQGKVAERLGISDSAVNQALGNVYAGRIDRIEARVRGEYMKATVTCPVLDEISTRDCIANQERNKKFRPTNDLRVRLKKACPLCPNREDA